MNQMTAVSTDIKALPEVAPANMIAVKANTFIRRQLDPEALKIAQDWAKLLIPNDPANPPSYITIADEDLDKLTEQAANLLRGISVDQMEQVDALTKKVNTDFQSIKVSELSPAAKRVLLFFRESANMIARRIRKIMNKYKTMEGEFQKDMAASLRMRDQFVELENHADLVGKETRESRYIVRIVAEACKIYLETYGKQKQDEMVAEVAKQQAIADEKGYELDDKWTEDLKTFKDYLILVESCMLEMESASQTAAMTYAGFDALETNMRLIAQALHNQAKVVIPNWMRMIGIKYIAYMGDKANSYLAAQDERNVAILKETATSLDMVFENIAIQLRRGQYSQEAMQLLNDTLVSGNEKLILAVAEFQKAHTATSAAYGEMKEKLSAVRLKYGKSQ